MKLAKNISVILIGVIFFFTSSGYVLYKSNCSCSGEEYATVFVKPQTCEEEFHKHHTHGISNEEQLCSESNCHECSTHTNSCGCDTPQIFFFKLVEKAVNEEAKYLLAQSVELDVFFTEVPDGLAIRKTELETENLSIDPPLLRYSPLDLLISIQQLKIPSRS